MVLYESESLTVSLPASAEWICVTCLAQPGWQTFKEGLMQALEHVRAHHVNCWLFNLEEIDALGEEEETWLQVQFFPQLMMLGRENFIALVVSENCYKNMLQEVGDYGLRSYNSFIIIDTFCHMADAENWLRSHLPRAVK